jgi:hypothetical protein
MGHSSILQALLDLKDVGYGGVTVDSMIQKLQSDGKLDSELQAKWDSHMYPDKAMTFTRMTIADQYMALSDSALRILTLMGLRCHQTGLIQVSVADLATLTGLKTRATQTAVKELLKTGCISVRIPAVRHTPPIYEVNGELFRKGKPTKGRFDYSACEKGGFLLARSMEHTAAVSTVHTKQIAADGTEKAIVYARITVSTAAQDAKREPAKDTSASSLHSSSNGSTIPSGAKKVKPQAAHGWDSYPDDLPGQVSIEDYIADLDDKRLPFN